MKAFFIVVAVLMIGLFVWRQAEIRELQSLEVQTGAKARKYDAENKAVKVKIARIQFDDAFADKLQRCLFYPPTQPKNIRACQKIVEQYDEHQKAW